MKVAFIISQTVSGDSNGIKTQAITWAGGLSSLNHEVELISPWGHYDWKSFDIIHAIGYGTWLEVIPHIAMRTNSKFVLTPMIDTERSPFLQKLGSYLGIRALRLTSPLYSLRSLQGYIAQYHVRSEHERKYLLNSLDIDSNLIRKIPLSCRFSPPTIKGERENFCLHVSILSSKNKNVFKLIDAAKRYKFRLVLAGSAGTDEFRVRLETIVRESENIEYLGFLREDELIDLYSKARVFALPSLFEGVGLVALEAGAFGADVVITNRGAPKEYYEGMAFLVDPSDVDSIGCAVVGALNGQSHQPELSRHIVDSYGNRTIVAKLEASYLELLR